jgi:hypothetical protein
VDYSLGRSGHNFCEGVPWSPWKVGRVRREVKGKCEKGMGNRGREKGNLEEGESGHRAGS